jgi:hypothetical protein
MWNDIIIEAEWRADRMLSSLLARRTGLPDRKTQLATTLDKMKAASPEYQAMYNAEKSYADYQQK